MPSGFVFPLSSNALSRPTEYNNARLRKVTLMGREEFTVRRWKKICQATWPWSEEWWSPHRIEFSSGCCWAKGLLKVLMLVFTACIYETIYLNRSSWTLGFSHASILHTTSMVVTVFRTHEIMYFRKPDHRVQSHCMPFIILRSHDMGTGFPSCFQCC